MRETKSKSTGKTKGDHSGRSSSAVNKNGIRRTANGKELAPRSLRKMGRVLLSDCTEMELNKLFN